MSSSKHSAEGAERPPKILVIDDEEIIHVSLRRILQRQGFHVTAVSAAVEGLQSLETEQYDLIITDLMMAGMNGIELLEKLKEDSNRVPVIMITGYPTIRTAVQALRLGAVDYLAKPFTRHELLGPVNRAMRRSVMVEQAGEQADKLAVQEGIRTPHVDLTPGDTFYLREHSWATFQQDGSMNLGIEESFLTTTGAVDRLHLPSEGELVEQGYVGFKIKTVTGELHTVFMPLSGQVVQRNQVALTEPGLISADTWLVKIIPSNLEQELPLLTRRTLRC